MPRGNYTHTHTTLIYTMATALTSPSRSAQKATREGTPHKVVATELFKKNTDAAMTAAQQVVRIMNLLDQNKELIANKWAKVVQDSTDEISKLLSAHDNWTRTSLHHLFPILEQLVLDLANFVKSPMQSFEGFVRACDHMTDRNDEVKQKVLGVAWDQLKQSTIHGVSSMFTGLTIQQDFDTPSTPKRK